MSFLEGRQRLAEYLLASNIIKEMDECNAKMIAIAYEPTTKFRTFYNSRIQSCDTDECAFRTMVAFLPNLNVNNYPTCTMPERLFNPLFQLLDLSMPTNEDLAAITFTSVAEIYNEASIPIPPQFREDQILLHVQTKIRNYNGRPMDALRDYRYVVENHSEQHVAVPISLSFRS
uniref:Uncharacterized protein n=1 Tax=Clandestinovirus TaxID=2831644 RepID=A0A8F8KR40_9VIRU|nr:hypothetical protein KOM_12_198 [Clandestinovirus]